MDLHSSRSAHSSFFTNGREIHRPTGETRRIRPAALSVSSHRAPSGPCRTSFVEVAGGASSPVTPVSIEREPHQHLPGERAGERAAFPRRKQRVVIERHAGWGDRGHPVFDGLLHALFRSALVNLRSVVVDAVADHRPSVVLASANDVDLVAAFRSVFDFPKDAGGGIDREALRVAVAVTQISGLASGRPTNGLSFGTDPSGAMRTILPR